MYEIVTTHGSCYSCVARIAVIQMPGNQTTCYQQIILGVVPP